MQNPWPRALAAALTLAALTPCAYAQSAPATQQQTLYYDLPAGSLATTLNAIARQAGQVVSLDPALVEGKQAPAVRGELSTLQALQQALQGSGLELRTTASGNFSVAPIIEANGALQLGTLSVSSNGMGAVTEGSGSYTTGAMQTATKLPLSIRETPQSVTVITRQRMDDQGMKTLDDVVQNAPGLVAKKLGPDRQRYYSRGFLVDNLMYDGLPSNSGGGAADIIASADLAIFDRVEIVRGSTGMMQGAGNPAAAINLIRKRPTRDTQISVSGSAGSWDRYRSELDASGALNEDGSIRGRTVAAYQNNQSFQDSARTERGVFYGILEADLDDATTFSAGASNQNDNNHIAWGGVPVAADGSDLHLSRSTYLGNDWDYWDKDTTNAFAGLEHRFDNGWKLNLTGNKSWARLQHLATKVLNTNDAFRQTIGGYHYTADQSSYDLFASGPFQLLNREHEFVLGGSWRDEQVDMQERSSSSVYPGMDIYDWDSGLVDKPDVLTGSFFQKTDTEQKSLYATTRLNVAETLKVILGGRLDWYDYESEIASGKSGYKATRNVTKYAGVIYDLNDRHSVYASYTDIFKPQSPLSASGSPLDPIVGKNYEIGIKGEYFGGALNASAAVFRMDLENRPKALENQQLCASYGAGVTCYEASGVVRSQGIELEVQGALTPNWQVGAGYTFNESKYKKDANKANEGRLFDSDLPRHLLKLSTTYQLSGDLQRWRLGGSLYRQNATYNKGTAYLVEQDASST